MSKNIVKIRKSLKEVTLWVHPEGPVIGSLFLQPEEENETGENPADVLNQEAPFVVLKSSIHGDVRFYNRASIIRVSYQGDISATAETKQHFQCQLQMMDGSMIEGKIHENLQPEYARLYDYLNKGKDRFVRVYTDSNEILLVNKSYIIQVTEKPV